VGAYKLKPHFYGTYMVKHHIEEVAYALELQLEWNSKCFFLEGHGVEWKACVRTQKDFGLDI